MDTLLMKMETAKKYILSRINIHPKIGLVLGSGLGEIADQIMNKTVIPYSEIPNFPVSTAPGHKGNLVVGEVEGKKVMAMQGRFHYYEGYTMQEVTFPIRVMQLLGVEKLFVTNAAGGLRPDLGPGTLLLLSDFINITGSNPLIGENIDALGVRFPDLSKGLNSEMRTLAMEVARKLKISLSEGVYAGIAGPYYMTKAELRMLMTMGADALGMSTVPEIIVGNHGGMKVLAISCITDTANPDQHKGVSGEEVLEVANKTKPVFMKLVRGILKEM